MTPMLVVHRPSAPTYTTIRDVLLLGALVALFGAASLLNLGSSTLPLSHTLDRIRITTVAMVLVVLTPYCFLQNTYHSIGWRSLRLLIPWCLFAATCLLSALLVRYGTRSVLGALWFLVGVPVWFFLIIPAVFGKRSSKYITISLFLSHVPYLLISVTLSPNLYFQYRGIFGHPNEVGVTATVGSICVLIAIIESIQRQRFSAGAQWKLLPTFAVLAFFVCLSGSRTSLLALLVCSSACACFFAKHWRSQHWVSAVVAVALVLSAASTLSGKLNVFERLWQKHSTSMSKGDTLSKRTEVWGEVWDDIAVLGNGIDYFERVIGVSPHNSVVRILGERGPVAALFLTVFAVGALLRAFRRATKAPVGEEMSCAPLIIGLCFWSLSLGEAMFGNLGTGITLAYYSTIGVLLRERTVHRDTRPGGTVAAMTGFHG